MKNTEVKNRFNAILKFKNQKNSTILAKHGDKHSNKWINLTVFNW